MINVVDKICTFVINFFVALFQSMLKKKFQYILPEISLFLWNFLEFRQISVFFLAIFQNVKFFAFGKILKSNAKLNLYRKNFMKY